MTATRSSTARLPPRSPVAPAVATAAAISLQRIRLGKRTGDPPLPAAHLHPRSPFAADVATAAAIVYQRVRLGKWYQRQPLPAAHLPPCPRLPQPLPGLLPSLCSGYGLQAVPPTDAAAMTGRRHRQPQQCPRPLNLIPAPHSPPPSARLPLVEPAAIGSEGMKATTAAATTGRRHRQPQRSCGPLTHPTFPGSPLLPLLLLSLRRA